MRFLSFFIIVFVASTTTGEDLKCEAPSEIPDLPGNAQRRERLRGAKGEIGDAGLKGTAGLPGQKGTAIIDLNAVQSKTDALLVTKLHSLTSHFHEKLQAFAISFREKMANRSGGAPTVTTEASTEPSTTPAATTRSASKIAELRSQGRCTMDFDGICYWAEVSRQRNVKKRDAKLKCGMLGGNLANIYNENLYQKLLVVAREAMPEYARTGILSLSIWTGMISDRFTGEVKQSDGISVGYHHWRNDAYPIKDWSRTGISIHVHRSASHSDQGMWNWDPNEDLNGGLCEI